MKWRQQWSRLLSDLSPQMQLTSINYKLWKKLIKHRHIDNDTLLLKLQSDIAIVDREFKNAIADCKKHKPSTIVHQYAKINKTTLYKIIKRCDKIRGTDFRDWYNKHMSAISFCSGVALKRLEIDIEGYSEECPLCFDRQSKIIILECGHCICTECCKQIYGVAQLRGTLTNVIHHAIYELGLHPRCPICRFKTPITLLGKNQVYTMKK